MDKKMCIFIVFLCAYFRANSQADQIITFTLPLSNINQAYPYDHTVVKANTTACTVVLKQSGSISQSVILIAKTTNNAPQISRSAYSRLIAMDYTDMDLENANKGKDQIVQIRGLSLSQTIYIFLIIFDIVQETYTVTIEVTQKTTITNYCLPSLGAPNPSKIYCANCLLPVNYGVYCQNLEIHLLEKVSYLTTINSKAFKSFVIIQPNTSITIQVKSNLNKTQVFIQFKNFLQQIAGLIDYHQINNQKGRFILSQEAKLYIKINNPTNDISLGVLNDNANPIQLEISYSIIRQLQPSKLLLIILAVGGGLLFIGLLIGAIIFIKNKVMQSRIQNINHVQPLQMQIIQNQLSNEQIQMYFPSVPIENTKVQMLDITQMNLEQKKRDIRIENDCVICLCPIQNSSIIKVTYCRHIFHSQCLIEWFKKLKNCPYCRKQFTKSATIQDYQHMVQSSGKNLLKGQQLIQQILKTNYNKSKLRSQIHA